MITKRQTFFFPFLFICIIASSGCSGQKKKNQSLLTWEYKREGDGVVPIESGYVLVKYSLSDTGYTRKEIFRTDYYVPHYSDFGTTIYDNRFLINKRGDIFDLDSNKIIHEHIGFDEFIEKNGDSVLMWHRNYEASPPFHNDTARHRAIKTAYYFFDLRTRKIIQLGKPGSYHDYERRTEELFGIYRAVAGIISPDRKSWAYFVPHKKNLSVDSLAICGWSRIFPTMGDIYVKFANNDSIKVADSILTNFSIWAPNFTPVTWLNDNELLTQKRNGWLVKITLKPYSITYYSPIQDASFCSFPPRFERTNDDRLYYYCAAKQASIFEVNTASNSLQPVTDIPLPYGYSAQPVSGHPSIEYASGYSFEGKNIITDTKTTIHYSISTTKKIAVQCKEIIPSRNQYDHWNTIKIFDPATQKWDSIKVEYLKQFIGWIEE